MRYVIYSCIIPVFTLNVLFLKLPYPFFLWFRQKDEEKTRRIFSEAEFLYIPDCGHNLHVQKRVLFAEVVGNFINRKSKKS
jgi:pimeloyl-ACP methyl ester carboxylesterase